VGIDIRYIAVDLIKKRLEHTHGEEIAGTYKVHGIPRDVAPPTRSSRRKRPELLLRRLARGESVEWETLNDDGIRYCTRRLTIPPSRYAASSVAMASRAFT
jgi:hypothetical protein